MTERDFAIGVAGMPSVASVSKKPSYLVTLDGGTGKAKDVQRFITFDKPDPINGFIQVKGVFSESSEEEIVKQFVDIIANTPKEKILDMMFPWHKIVSIRSLVFNANKTQTLVK